MDSKSSVRQLRVISTDLISIIILSSRLLDCLFIESLTDDTQHFDYNQHLHIDSHHVVH